MRRSWKLKRELVHSVRLGTRHDGFDLFFFSDLLVRAC